MEEIEYNRERLNIRLESAMRITELNKMILNFADEVLASVGPMPNKLGGDAVNNQRKSLVKLSKNDEINKTLKILHGQQIVLFISAFETYMRDLVRILSDQYPDLMTWPNNNYKIDLNELADPSVSKGDVLLSSILKQGTSFQDLKSIYRFFDEYLSINLEPIVDQIHVNQFILATAMRHVIVHSNGQVNKEFAKSTRTLPDAVKNAYEIGKDLGATEDDITATRDTLMVLADAIEYQLKEKIMHYES